MLYLTLMYLMAASLISAVFSDANFMPIDSQELFAPDQLNLEAGFKRKPSFGKDISLGSYINFNKYHMHNQQYAETGQCMINQMTTSTKESLQR